MNTGFASNRSRVCRFNPKSGRRISARPVFLKLSQFTEHHFPVPVQHLPLPLVEPHPTPTNTNGLE